MTFGVWAGDWTGTAFDVVAETTARPIVFTSRHWGLPDMVVFDFISYPPNDVWRTEGQPDLKITFEDRQAGATVTLITESLETL